MTTQSELQAERNKEGRELAKAVAGEISKVEEKLNKENSAWLESGGEKVLGATGGGSKGLNQRSHAEAKKLGAK